MQIVKDCIPWKTENRQTVHLIYPLLIDDNIRVFEQGLRDCRLVAGVEANGGLLDGTDGTGLLRHQTRRRTIGTHAGKHREAQYERCNTADCG